jgi:tetratricopeptide (TPR) repeat protein
MAEQDYKFYLNSGIDKTNRGLYEEALEVLEKALGLNSENALIYFSKAIAYHNLNQLRAAYENYSHAIEKDKNMIDAYYNRAQTILAFDNPTEEELEEALEDLTCATNLDEKFVDAHYYSAVIKKKLGRYESAIESLNKVLEIEPQAPYSRALKKLIEQKYL